MLTSDASGELVEPFARVFQFEWKDGDAWRAAIKTYHYGRWQSRLRRWCIPGHGLSAGER